MKGYYVGYLICFSWLVMGCAQESNSTKGSVNPPSETPVEESKDTVPVEENKVKTSDLETLAEFDFNSQQPLVVKVDLPELEAERAIANICYSNDDGSINRSNCLLQSTLNAGLLTAELSLGAHHEDLVMEVWRFSDLENPLVYHWSMLDGPLWWVQ